MAATSDTKLLDINSTNFINNGTIDKIKYVGGAPKCCTKQKKCNPQPKCYKKELTHQEIFIYFLWFDAFIVLLRWAVAKPGENKFYLFYWIQIQLLVVYGLIYFMIFTYDKSVILFNVIKGQAAVHCNRHRPGL